MEILKRNSWKGANTFTKHYDKHLINKGDFADFGFVTPTIRAEPSRIQKLGKRYNEFTNQQNILSHKWFKNTTDLIFEILLSCHKWHQIFQASKGFRNSFNKHG